MSNGDDRVIRTRVVVHGLVQGVFFRDACRSQAQRLGVAGSVRNEYDGTVVASFEGRPDAVQQMLAWARRGPSKAHVERIDVTNEEPQGARGFTIA